MSTVFSYIGPESDRIDKILPKLLDDISRSYIQKLCESGDILLNSIPADKKDQLCARDVVSITLPYSDLGITAEKMNLDIVYSDKNFAVINKDVGVNVHPVPGPGGTTGTLVNGLLAEFEDLSTINGIERPGIVHRLDKDTSGLLVIAKNDKTMQALQELFQVRLIGKTYTALLVGGLSEKRGRIESEIGRDPRHRKKMTSKGPINPKEAVSEYEVVDELTLNGGTYSLVHVKILTGRTHQIRVHFADIGHPVVGDQLYGISKVNGVFEKKFGLSRQFLHASKLEFEMFGEQYSFEGDLKEDLLKVIKK